MGVTSVIQDYGTELLNAVRDNDLKTFKTTCEKYLKHDSQIAELCTSDIKHRPTKKFACPFIIAARLSDPTILRYMLSIGVNANFIHHTVTSSSRPEMLTALHIATELGYTRSVEILMNHNADPNIQDQNGETALLIATKKSDWVSLRMMLANGGNPKNVDRYGNAPLHIAALYGHTQMVKTLLKHDADMHQKGHLGAIPSHIAAREGHIHLIQVFCYGDNGLINARIPCFADKREKAMIHIASEHAHAETVIALIDQFNADVNLRDSEGNTPLHCVVLNNYHPYKMRDKDYFYTTAKILIKYKTSINEKNSNGATALHLAAAHNHPKIVELLLSVGANAFAENNNRLKPIDVVPESDTVSKQLLKTAMANPKPPINTSSLSLAQNTSFHAGFPLNHLQTSMNRSFPANMNYSGSKQALLMNNSMMMQKYKQPPYDSLNSSASTIVMHKMKNGNLIVSPRSARYKADPLNRSHHLMNRSGRNYNAYDQYANHFHQRPPHGYHHQHHSSRHNRSRRSSLSNVNSSFSSSMHDLSKLEREMKKKSRPREYSREYSSSSSVEEKLNKSHGRHKSSDTRRYSKSSVSRRTHHRNEFYLSSDESADRKHERSKASLRHQKGRKGSKFDLNSLNKEGVRVHTIPGKLSTVEVEYASGPITIEIEKQDDENLQNDKKPKNATKQNRETKHKRQKYLEEVQREKTNKNKPVNVKNGDDNNSDNPNKEYISDWYETMKSYKKKDKNSDNIDDDSDEVFNEEEEEENEDRDDREKKRSLEKNNYTETTVPITDNGNVRKKTNRDKRLMRQKLFDEQLEMEKMPIVDPEPPNENLEVELDDGALDESSVDSDSIEEEINETQRILNESASRRISQVMDSIRRRWSDDEFVKEKTDKFNYNKIKDKKSASVTQTEDLTANKNNYTTNLIETTYDKTVKLETLSSADNETNFNKETNEEEELSPNPKNGTKKNSLNIRVSGDTPKAYSRKDKYSARKKFIQAAPVKIESSSEASDNELNLSRASLQELDTNSLQRRAEWNKPLAPHQPNVIPKERKNFKNKIPSTNTEELKKPSGLKPYKSFGTIEIKTDALEEALKEGQTDSGVNLSTNSTIIIPELYKIKKPNSEDKKKATKYSIEDNSLSDSSVTDRSFDKNGKENSNVKEKNVNIKFNNKIKDSSKMTKNSLESLLESYSEEPHFRRRKKETSIDMTNSPESTTTFNDNLNDDSFNLETTVKHPEEEEIKTRKKTTKQAKKKKFILPEGLSPEVWEEASNHAPLASSDTFSDLSSKNEKKRQKKTKPSDPKILEDDSQQTIDWDTTNNTDMSKYTFDLDTLGLDVCIPAAHEDNSSGNKGFRKTQKTIELNISPTNKETKTVRTKRGDGYVEVVTTTTTEIENVETQTIEKRPSKLKNKNKQVEDSKKDLIYSSIQFSKKPVKKDKPPIPMPEKTIPIVMETSIYNNKAAEKAKSLKYYSSDNEAEIAYNLNLEQFQKKTKKPLPKHPHKPYDIHRMSDSEGSPSRRPNRNYYIHSEAEASDYEPPDKPGPGMTYKQAALKSINSQMRSNQYRSFLLRQPGHHDKNFNYLRKLYRPPRGRRCKTRHLFGTAGKYGQYELRRVMSNQSFAESESEVDPNKSFISDEQEDGESWHGSTASLTAKSENPIYKSLIKYRKLKELREEMKKNESKPIAPLEPEGVNLEKYSDIARIWLEQVDSKTVQRSDKMYLSVLPGGKNIPSSLYSANKNFKNEERYNRDRMPQWVIARSRVKGKSSYKDSFSESMLEHDASALSFDRHLVLFFKIGFNWMELAWVLFDGLLRESQIIRMIKDIQLKHPDCLTDQITDLMQRWWHRKGENATIQELQKALDIAQLFYIQEEILNDGSPAVSKFHTTEDILDTGVVTLDDPNVSRISQEYNTRSLNSSFVSSSKGARLMDELNPEDVLKRIQQSKVVPVGMNEILTRASRAPSRSESRDGTIIRDDGVLDKLSIKETNFSNDLPNSVVDSVKEKSSQSPADVIVLNKKKKKPYKHETNF